MIHMLDTDTVSYALRDYGGVHVLQKLKTLKPGEACVSVMTRAELLYGLKNLPAQHRLHVGVKKFLDSVDVLPWQSEAAEFYADIRHELTRTGTPIGEMDMLIAAHAIAADAVLVTNNTRHFKRIKLPMMMANWME
jgi:tRNA(fMet)-specific endonuclease VapC